MLDIRMGGLCFLLNWFRQAGILMAIICWWLSCEADAGSKCAADSMLGRWSAC